MTIPFKEDFSIPFLRCLEDREEHVVNEVIEYLAQQVFNLTDADMRDVISSGESRFANRVRWAAFEMRLAKLAVMPQRGHIQITDEGVKVANNPPEKFGHKFLMRYGGYREYIENKRSAQKMQPASTDAEAETLAAIPPEEIIESAQYEIDSALEKEILDKALSLSPAAFERLLLKLLEKVVHGEKGGDLARHLGGPGDKGVDGVVYQDSLGLERIYMQAKRYQEGVTVGPGEIQQFAGSLGIHRAAKGLFVTTSKYTDAAKKAAEQSDKNIVLIDGAKLARLMRKYSVGCRAKSVIEIKELDEQLFESL